MSQWVIKGMRSGIKTTSYPKSTERAAGVTPGLPAGGDLNGEPAKALTDCCPSQVFRLEGSRMIADVRRCLHCYRCIRAVERPANWEQSYEWATVCNDQNEFVPAFRKSVHVLVVDAGGCGACLSEVRQLNNPYYNMHRLGFFITPTPRHADILLAVGPVTDHLCYTIEKIYDAMPAPKRVIAAGACALSGGAFAESPVSAKGVADVLPVDVEVPGDPPPPLALLHGLLLASGRTQPACTLPTSQEEKVVK